MFTQVSTMKLPENRNGSEPQHLKCQVYEGLIPMLRGKNSWGVMFSHSFQGRNKYSLKEGKY